MTVGVFEQQRPRLLSIAYGMLGSVMEAEDIVQDTYIRWSTIDHGQIESPEAFLTTITSRLAIDYLRSARKRREEYVGPWLPEPIVGDFDRDPADLVAEAESLSMSALVALERLNPVERVVLLLRDTFDLDYAQIADIVDKSPANCRQIARRARERAGDPTRPATSSSEAEVEIIQRYFEAIAAGDVDGLAEIFAEDVILWADGGGKARAARHPLHGDVRVAKYLIGVAPQMPAETEVRVVRVNGAPGIVGELNGQTIGVILFEIEEGVVVSVRSVLNPDKLQHLSPKPYSEHGLR